MMAENCALYLWNFFFGNDRDTELRVSFADAIDNPREQRERMTENYAFLMIVEERAANRFASEFFSLLLLLWTLEKEIVDR